MARIRAQRIEGQLGSGLLATDVRRGQDIPGNRELIARVAAPLAIGVSLVSIRDPAAVVDVIEHAVAVEVTDRVLRALADNETANCSAAQSGGGGDQAPVGGDDDAAAKPFVLCGLRRHLCLDIVPGIGEREAGQVVDLDLTGLCRCALVEAWGADGHPRPVDVQGRAVPTEDREAISWEARAPFPGLPDPSRAARWVALEEDRHERLRRIGSEVHLCNESSPVEVDGASEP